MTIRSMPSTPEYRENYDRIFRRTPEKDLPGPEPGSTLETYTAEKERLYRAMQDWGFVEVPDPKRRAP